MTVKINFKTGNAAFENDGEIGRILREIADQAGDGPISGNVLDVNGNVVGKYSITR